MLVSGINSNSNKQNFKARNAEIRYVDNIMRCVINNFSGISLSRHQDYIDVRNLKLSNKQISRFKKYGYELNISRILRPDPKRPPRKYVDGFLAEVTKDKLTNCGEFGSLSKIGLAANGLDSYKVFLVGILEDGEIVDLDHSFAISDMKKLADKRAHKKKFDNKFVIGKIDDALDILDPRCFGVKSVVVDAWMGFVDYSVNAFKKFQSFYSKYPDSSNLSKLGIVLDDFVIDSNHANELSKKLPSLKAPKEHYFK